MALLRGAAKRRPAAKPPRNAKSRRLDAGGIR
jgi:hypothetical protein